MTGGGEADNRRAHRPAALIAFAALLTLAFAGFCALGIWQLQRLEWKRELIARVEARVHAPPVAAPGPAQWPELNARNSEYLHVRLRGEYLPGRDTRVQAVTTLGPGFWLLTPLQTDEGAVVLVNRGFAPADATPAPPTGPVVVTGLLRLSEPGGAFLRHNDAGAERWYSRDVQAIAAARGLTDVAPYFVDADAASGPQWPRGGLTVTHFSNNHLSYALTWFALALMVAGAGGYLAREESRLRRRAGQRSRFAHDAGPSQRQH